eukprot:TRINITY_DN153868_c0_g1_i1.p1 TRINITY_DN153868_c0_g1~~TRINITY_DN153868_c0_g1_i1.p1  ORF type:complete len:310 (-),score=25.04 TRINITY_DN153868_c0_g1_i1:126-1055(-)
MLFYLATRFHPNLEGKNSIKKFFSVKIIIFATYWQSLIVFLLPNLNHNKRDKWNNFILCLEMPFFALLQSWAFPCSEFKSIDPISTTTIHSVTSRRTSALKNATDAVNMHDVVTDAYYNFHKKYRAHLKLQDEAEHCSTPDARGRASTRRKSDPINYGPFPPAKQSPTTSATVIGRQEIYDEPRNKDGVVVECESDGSSRIPQSSHAPCIHLMSPRQEDGDCLYLADESPSSRAMNSSIFEGAMVMEDPQRYIAGKKSAISGTPVAQTLYSSIENMFVRKKKKGFRRQLDIVDNASDERRASASSSILA